MKDYYVLYNAPYTPQLNPIEETFSFIKRNVRKANPQNLKNLNEAIFNACKLLTPTIANSFIYSCMKWMKVCLNNKDLLQ